MSTDTNYCDACRAIIPCLLLKPDKYETLPSETWVYHENFGALEISVAQGCRLCRLMRQRILLLAENPTNLYSCNHAITISLNKQQSLIGRACFELGCQEECSWHTEHPNGICAWFAIELVLDDDELPEESSDESEESEDERRLPPPEAFSTNASGEVVVKAGFLPSLEELNSRERTKRYMRSIRFLTDKKDNRDIGGMRVPGAHGNSDATINQARQWLSDCDSLHDLCGTFRMANLCPTIEDPKWRRGNCPLIDNDLYHPKRLLYIRGDSNSLVVQMVDADTPGFADTYASHEGKYVCLSYRWGVATHKMVLTKSNADEKRKTISIDLLPQTFGDAVRICKSLGISYIWIDALCIEQPSEVDDGDWAEQSYQMDQIYGNSYFTLAAASSSDVYEGMFFDRPAVPWLVETCRLTLQDHYHFVDDDRPRHRTGSIIPVTVPWWQSVSAAPLQMRGWVVQERMLSARILHWSRNALFWECRECKASEYEPMQVHECHFDSNRDSLNISELTDFGKEEKYNGERWCDIMQAFSRRQFTKPSDRLHAISGIVSQIQQVAPDKYLAGHWEKSLFKTLLWRVQEPASAQRVANIPTWSWASANSAIRFSKTLFMPEELDLVDIELIRTDFKRADANPFGNLEKGQLTLRGDLAVLRTSATTWEGHGLIHSKGLHLWLDRMEDQRRIVAGEEAIIICLRLFEMRPYFLAAYRDPETFRGLKNERMQDEYLMLRSTGRTNEYVRIGVLTAQFYADLELLLPVGQGTIGLV